MAARKSFALVFVIVVVVFLSVPAIPLAATSGLDRDAMRPIECGDSVTAEILGVLFTAGNINAAEYADSCSRLREVDRSRPPVGAALDPTWDLEWNDGFKLSRSDGAFKLKFGGRIMLDSGFFGVSKRLKKDFDSLMIDSPNGSGVEFRRARIFFSGDVYDRVFFKAEYDFAQAEEVDNPDFKDVLLGLENLGPVGSLQVGHFKEPIFLQEATSSKYITFMERGLNSTFYAGRNVGLMATGDWAEKKLYWQLGIFRVANDQGFAFESWGNEEWDVVGRLSMTPLYSAEGAHVLHLGVGYMHRFMDSSAGSTRYRSRPEANLAQYFSDTGEFPAFGSDILNVEVAYVAGPFSLQSEFTNVWIAGVNSQRDLEFRSGYVFVSCFLTGEHRAYDLGKGRFGRVTPRANFDPANGHWGAVELAFRYSFLDLDNNGIEGGNAWDLTAGINWYLFPNLRWMLNYIHAEVRDRTAEPPSFVLGPGPIDGSAEIVESRIQIDF